MVTVAWVDNQIRFLDQTKLPAAEVYVDTDDVRRLGEAIRRLEIRGAPAIGVAAAYGVVLAVRPTMSLAEAGDACGLAASFLASTRPTAVNLFTALRRMRKAAASFQGSNAEDFRNYLLSEAAAIMREDIEACRRIGELGAALIAPGSSVLTHCNAGALATAGIGTAIGVITTAARQGKILRVYVDETRPLLQGARLTSWELVQAGIEAVLITDSTAGTVLQRGLVQAVIVGADRIAANGDTANKVGTYPLAVLARRHGIPFYVAAPTTTLDHHAPSGAAIPIEERNAAEVTHCGDVQVAAQGVKAFAPAFDVTPNELISAIVTEAGVFRPPFAASIASVGTP